MQVVKTSVVLKLAQPRWTGHVIRMPDERPPTKVFYGELQEGKRSQCGQKKTQQRHPLKASVKDFEIPTGSSELTAQDQSKWRGLIIKGTTLYEEKGIRDAERKHRDCKPKTDGPPADSIISLVSYGKP